MSAFDAYLPTGATPSASLKGHLTAIGKGDAKAITKATTSLAKDTKSTDAESWLSSITSAPTTESLKSLQATLADRVYLTGSTLTFADFIVFDHVHSSLVRMNRQEKKPKRKQLL